MNYRGLGDLARRWGWLSQLIALGSAVWWDTSSPLLDAKALSQTLATGSLENGSEGYVRQC